MWKWVLGGVVILGLLTCLGAVGGAGWWLWGKKQAAEAEERALEARAEEARAAEETLRAASAARADHLGEARVAYAAGDYARAVDEWTALLEAEPQNAEALRGRGKSHAKLEQFDLAADDLHEATRVDGANAEGWDSYGWVLGRMGRDDEAVEAYDRLVAIDGNNAKAWRDRANARYHAGDAPGARADASRACGLGLQDGCALADRIKAASR